MIKLTLEDCQKEVAKKHRLGEKLVTGHKKSYFDEATEMYVEELKDEFGKYKHDDNNRLQGWYSKGLEDGTKEAYILLEENKELKKNLEFFQNRMISYIKLWYNAMDEKMKLKKEIELLKISQNAYLLYISPYSKK